MGAHTASWGNPRRGDNDGRRMPTGAWPHPYRFVVIHEVDESLRALIADEPMNGGVDVSFEAPTKDWSSRQGSPTVNVFLYDIREDLGRRDVGPQPVLNDEGRIIARKPPVRRFKLSYLLTAWTQRPEDEHRLLSVLLSRLLRFSAIPDEYLDGSLTDIDVPVVLDLALPPSAERSLSDIWSALGGELKPSLDLAVIAPFDPDRAFETGPPVIEEPILGIHPSPGNGPPHRPTRTPDDDGGEEVVAGGDKPGRTIRLKRISEPN